MFETLVWATDGSDAANGALPYVEQLAEPGATIYVVHVREIVVGYGGGYLPYVDEPGVEDAIADQVSALRAEGFDARLRILTAPASYAALTIADVARDVDAEAILVGTHGHGRIAGLLLGSTTQGLLHAGVCPVFAVPCRSGAEGSAREVATAATI